MPFRITIAVMADMSDYLAKLKELTEGDKPIPADIVDGISQVWENQSVALEGATIQITEKDSAIAASNAEISKLKAANYDLTIKASAVQPDSTPDTETKHKAGLAGLFQPRKVN